MTRVGVTPTHTRRGLLSRMMRRLLDDIDPLAWRGFTSRGRLWGYPYAVEAALETIDAAFTTPVRAGLSL